MASYVSKTVTCDCCGKEYTTKVVKGFYQNYPMDLDMNPHNPAVFENVRICPYCKYTNLSTADEANAKKWEAVRSEQYQKIYADSRYDETARNLRLAAYIAEYTENWKEAAEFFLKTAWYFREHYKEEERGAREKAIVCFEKYLEQVPDTEYAVILVDCLRQTGRFEEALETADSLLPYISGNLELCRILNYEKQLIGQRDSAPHSVSEVF